MGGGDRSEIDASIANGEDQTPSVHIAGRGAAALFRPHQPHLRRSSKVKSSCRFFIYLIPSNYYSPFLIYRPLSLTMSLFGSSSSADLSSKEVKDSLIKQVQGEAAMANARNLIAVR